MTPRQFLDMPVVAYDECGERYDSAVVGDITEADQGRLKALIVRGMTHGCDAEYQRMEAAFRPRLRWAVGHVKVRIAE